MPVLRAHGGRAPAGQLDSKRPQHCDAPRRTAPGPCTAAQDLRGTSGRPRTHPPKRKVKHDGSEEHSTSQEPSAVSPWRRNDRMGGRAVLADSTGMNKSVPKTGGHLTLVVCRCPRKTLRAREKSRTRRGRPLGSETEQPHDPRPQPIQRMPLRCTRAISASAHPMCNQRHMAPRHEARGSRPLPGPTGNALGCPRPNTAMDVNTPRTAVRGNEGSAA